MATTRPETSPLSRVATGGALAVMALAVAVMAGRLLDIDPLEHVLPQLAPMKFNTALGFLLAGGALFFRGTPAVRLGLAGAVGLLGALTFGQYLAGMNFGIDQLVLRDAEPVSGQPPGRMSISSALCFLASSGALGLLGRRTTERWAEALAIGVGAVSVVALLGYSFGAENLYSVPGFASVSLHAALGFAILAAGVLCAIPEGLVALLVQSRSTAQPLWLGFAGLTLLLLALGVTFATGLHAIGGDVDVQADVAQIRSVAARELEANVLAYELEVRAFLGGDAAARERRLQSAGNVAQHLATYERLAETPRHRELAARFAAHWQPLHALNEALVTAGQATPRELAAVVRRRLELGDFLETELHPETFAAYDVRRANTRETIQTTEALTLLLLIGGVALALVTSGVVVRAVIGGEERLREAGARLKTAAEAGGVGIWDWNVQSNELIWDDAMFALYGVRREDFSGAYDAWATRLHPDDKDTVEAYTQHVLAGTGEYAPEFKVLWPDGSVHYLLSNARVVRDADGTPLRMVGTNVDVTARKRRDRNLVFLADLQKAYAPLATAAELVRTTCERIATHLELAHCCAAEIRDEADEGTVLHDCHATGTRDLAGDYRLSDFFNAEERRALRAGETMVVDDVRAAERDAAKTAQFEALGIRAVVNAGVVTQGRWGFVLHVSRGVPTTWTPEEVELVTELASRLFVRLERARAEEQLRASEAALRDADRRKDEFLAMLAHELRNPLAPVRNAVAILRATGPAIPEVQWAQDVIDRQTQALARLIDDLMDVSRISQGKIELKRKCVELEKIVEGALESSRPLIDEMGHALAVTLPSRPVFVDADLIRLGQVFQNLLSNAAKYTERGGRIHLRVELQGSDVMVSVTDTGIGIPADKLPTIFEMFSQVQGALSRSQGGLGIGLHLVKRLVEMHDGRVEARSGGPGRGSEFVVRLPIVVEQTYPRQAHGDGVKATPTAGLRILVVDDNQDAAESSAMLLKFMGNHVQMAHDGEEAVAAARALRPQVVLCDIGLPKLNGYEVCRQIRAEAWAETTILIAVTGWGQDDARRQSAEAGSDHHMVKPVDPDALMTLLAGLDTVRPVSGA